MRDYFHWHPEWNRKEGLGIFSLLPSTAISKRKHSAWGCRVSHRPEWGPDFIPLGKCKPNFVKQKANLSWEERKTFSFCVSGATFLSEAWLGIPVSLVTGSKLVLGNQECQNSRPCLGRDLRRHLILLVTLCWFSKCSLGTLGVPKTCLLLYKTQIIFLVTLMLYLLVSLSFSPQ